MPVSASAQLLDGAAGGVGSSGIVGNDVAMTAEGSHFVSGTFRGTATFGSVSITASAGTNWDDAFLVRYDADGEPLWARRGGTPLWNDMGNAVAAGPDGGAYWAGAFTAESTFDGGDNPDLSITNIADWDVFVARYDADGDIQWLTGLRGTGQNIGQGITVDAEGNAYVVGLVRETASIGGVTLESAGSSDAFVIKLAPDGEALWGITMGGIDGVGAYEVDVHPEGGVVVSGQFRGVALFGGVPMQSAGLNDTFAARLDADGEVLWASRFGAGGDEFNRGVAVAPDGSIYLTGSFEQQMLIGTDILTSAGASDVYVVKLDAEGTPLWGRRAGGGGFDFGESVAVDHQGNVYAAGYVDGSGTFATGNGDLPYSSAGFTDAYLVAYSPEGDLLEMELVGNTNVDRGSGVAVSDPVGRLAMTGFFRSSITVGNVTVQGVSGNDAFIAFGNTIAGAPAIGPIAFVDAGAPPEGDGQSWATAFADLQDALDLAREHPGIVQQIWVAAGTYRPAGDTDFRASFDLVDGVALYGGFAGAETHLDDRDPESNVTTLTGLLSDGPPAVRSIHVVTAEDVTATLDGFVVTNGCACGTPESSSNDLEDLRGGGLVAVESHLTLAGMVFTANWAGGGTDVGPQHGRGGAMHVSGGSLVMERSRFAGNSASSWHGGTGGAIYAIGGEVTILDTDFSSNAIAGPPPGVGWGGALTFQDADAVLRRVTFYRNGASGGLSGAVAAHASHVVILESDFIENRAGNVGSTGAIGVTENSHLILINSRLHGNWADRATGAVRIASGTSALVVNSEFVRNEVVASYNESNVGGGISNFGNTTIINSTFVNNRVYEQYQHRGTAVLNSGESADLTIRNTIMWHPASNVVPVHNVGGTVSVIRAIIRNGFEGGVGVLDADPLFELDPWQDPDGYGDLRLQWESPAVDFGLAEFLPPDTYDLDGDGDTTEPIPIDLAGEPRVQGSEVDLGAYESPFHIAADGDPGPNKARLDVYPNPVLGATAVHLSVPRDQSRLRLELIDVLGRRAAVLHDGPLGAGESSFELHAAGLAPGVYFVRAIGEDVRIPAVTLTVIR